MTSNRILAAHKEWLKQERERQQACPEWAPHTNPIVDSPSPLQEPLPEHGRGMTHDDYVAFRRGLLTNLLQPGEVVFRPFPPEEESDIIDDDDVPDFFDSPADTLEPSQTVDLKMWSEEDSVSQVKALTDALRGLMEHQPLVTAPVIPETLEHGPWRCEDCGATCPGEADEMLHGDCNLGKAQRALGDDLLLAKDEDVTEVVPGSTGRNEDEVHYLLIQTPISTPLGADSKLQLMADTETNRKTLNMSEEDILRLLIGKPTGRDGTTIRRVSVTQ